MLKHSGVCVLPIQEFQQKLQLFGRIVFHAGRGAQDAQG